MSNNQLPVVFANNMHRPMLSTDTVDPGIVPRSSLPGNQIQSFTDGLYVGNSVGAPVFYVAAAGVDQPGNGTTKAAPFRTLQYALQQIAASCIGGVFDRVVTIALKAGETFVMSADFYNRGDLTFTFYGSALYGDFDGPAIGTGARPATMADLERPVINVSNFAVNGVWQCAGVRGQAHNALHLMGVRLNLSPKPAVAPDTSLYGGFSDFYTATGLSESLLELEGTIVNMNFNTVFGLLGVHARAREANLIQYASQLRIDNILVTAAVTNVNQLTARQYYLKFYNAGPGANSGAIPLVATSTNSSSGSGVLNLNWIETQAQIVTGAVTNLPTFPTLFDASFGLRTYFTGLVRDQQQRPLNVSSGRLF